MTFAENAAASNSGTFADFDDGVTISVSGGGSVTQDNTAHTWSWSQAAPLADGDHTITITATNADNTVSTTTFTLHVTDVAPTVSADQSTVTFAENAAASNSGTFADFDDGVTISVSGGGSVTQDNTAHTWSWSQAAPLADGDHTITITATNADNTVSTTTFTLHVTDVAPTVSADQSTV